VSGKISVIGEVPVSATLTGDARGADVVVAAADADVAAAVRRSPAAVLLLVDAGSEQVARALDATLWPRQRVLGVAARDLDAAVRAVAEGATAQVRATLRDGEREVTLGPGGVLV
jgi:hypothetical protein